MKRPDRIVINKTEVEDLKKKIASVPSLSESDKKIIAAIFDFYFWLQGVLQETKMINLARLRSFFGLGKKTEKRRHLPAEDDIDLSQVDSDHAALLEKAKEVTDAHLKFVEPNLKKKNGRLGHEAYTGAVTKEKSHEHLKSGDGCPSHCGGRLYLDKPNTFICLEGNALASATLHVLEKLRCGLCGQTYATSLGAGVQKYAPSLKAQIAIAKNYAGLPFCRIEKLQEMVGVPLPDSTQWDLSESLANDIYPVFYYLEHLAAQGETLHQDDTMVRILSLMKENQDDPDIERKGMYTTGIVSLVESKKIFIFYSGRRHAGENMEKLLAKRSKSLLSVVPIRMSDALSSNLSVSLKIILALCLTHARRKFYEIYDYFTGECRLVIDTLAQVYHHDEIAKQEGLSPQERLIYHQTLSAPLMNSLKKWMAAQLDDQKVEPNSRLGKAFRYMLKHWEGLTCFLRVAGAPLDNNRIEQALKIPIRCRKNSLFYKTEHGAFVGCMFTSIIHTCVMAGENPFHYLVSLQSNKKSLFKNPHLWLPWNYQQQLAPPLIPAPFFQDRLKAIAALGRTP